jgi:hypothetical protein
VDIPNDAVLLGLAVGARNTLACQTLIKHTFLAGDNFDELGRRVSSALKKVCVIINDADDWVPGVNVLERKKNQKRPLAQPESAPPLFRCLLRVFERALAKAIRS